MLANLGLLFLAWIQSDVVRWGSQSTIMTEALHSVVRKTAMFWAKQLLPLPPFSPPINTIMTHSLILLMTLGQRVDELGATPFLCSKSNVNLMLTSVNWLIFDGF